jgi:acetylornithine deacetylase/succinyl-diaminopimelate desuccinylase-like protein
MIGILYEIQTRLADSFKSRPSGYLPPASLNIGTIRGGVSFNVVADACNVLIDRRTLPGETVESARREILEIIEALRKDDPDIDVSLELLGSGEPFQTSPDETICQIARQTMMELGLNPDFVGYEQVSDGRFFAEKGIPTILIGPGIAQQAHTPNERLELDQYMEAIKIYALLAINALG